VVLSVAFPFKKGPIFKTISNLAIWKNVRPSRWKKSHFFRSPFSCERDKQPTMKFNIDTEVLFIYRLIPRKPGFRESMVFFDTTPISRFAGLLLEIVKSSRFPLSPLLKSHRFQTPIFRKRGSLYLKTEIEKLPSNFT
jgi:hypothetical protein